MKKKRLDKIIDIITEHEVDTQDELIAYLRAEGFTVTQATVSRDIRELQLTKIMTGRGSYRYVMPTKSAESGLHFNHAVAETITRADSAQNIIVLHTYPGMAQAVALEVDNLHHPELLGCVAGDDTVIIVATDAMRALKVREEIKDMIRSRRAQRGF